MPYHFHNQWGKPKGQSYHIIQLNQHFKTSTIGCIYAKYTNLQFQKNAHSNVHLQKNCTDTLTSIMKLIPNPSRSVVHLLNQNSKQSKGSNAIFFYAQITPTRL